MSLSNQELKDLVEKMVVAQFKREAEQAKLNSASDELAETSRLVRELSKTVDGIGKSQGMVAEEFFFNSLNADPTIAGIHYDSVTSKFKRSKHGKSTEIDILLENGSSLAVAEVKYRVRAKDIVQVQNILRTLRDFFPQYAHYTVYAGLAGFSFDDGVIEQAHEQGLFVLKRKGDVIEDDSIGVRTF